MNSEAQLIDRYFRGIGCPREDVLLGIGDDAALLAPGADSELVLTTDALVEGVHFLPQSPPRSLGHRSLAVNLSDLAAMGASPCWMLLSLTLPQTLPEWLAEFCSGLDALARRHEVALVGGNLSRGPLSITILLAGQVPRGQALRRDGGRPGDLLYVSGSVGDAAAGRELADSPTMVTADEGAHPQAPPADSATALLRRRFEYPEPRVALGQALRGLASACIDLSDGLYIDALRLASASGCAAHLEVAALPLSAALRSQRGSDAERLALGGGEDYELCFSAPPGQARPIAAAAGRLGVSVSCIGSLQGGSGLTMAAPTPQTFDHFRS